MIISQKHRFVIFAPWKTASSTLGLRFRSYDQSPYPRFFYFNPHLNRVVHQHLTLADFRLLPESRLGYMTASFVRNPYDRAYSGFIQLQRDIAEQPRAVYPSEWIKELVRAQLAENAQRLLRRRLSRAALIKLIAQLPPCVTAMEACCGAHHLGRVLQA